MFKFGLNDLVIVKETGKRAQIQGRAEYSYDDTQYAIVDFESGESDWVSANEILEINIKVLNKLNKINSSK